MKLDTDLIWLISGISAFLGQKVTQTSEQYICWDMEDEADKSKVAILIEKRRVILFPESLKDKDYFAISGLASGMDFEIVEGFEDEEDEEDGQDNAKD